MLLIFLALYSWIWIFQNILCDEMGSMHKALLCMKYDGYPEEKLVWLNCELDYPLFKNRRLFLLEK